MRIYLDDAACEQLSAADSVAAAVSAAADIARQRGRTIVDVIVDGSRWSADRIAGPDASRAGAAKEVRLASADPADVVCEAFVDAAAALQEIDGLQQRAAESLQAGDTPRGMNDLAQAMSLWGSVHQAVSMGAAMANIDLAPHQSIIEALTIQLRSMRSALEASDQVALADTLLYDLPETVSRWRSLLHGLRERVRSDAKGRPQT